jgi:hypothetical protein
MRFVHQQHQVGQARQIGEVAFADVLGQSLDARAAAAAHFGVDLGDIEDVDARTAEQRTTGRVMLIVVVASDNRGRVRCELGNPLEHILRRVRREVRDQLVVDGQIRCQHEEVVYAVRQVQVRDKRAHQPRLANAGGQGEAQRWKLALEVRDRWKLAADDRQRSGRIRGLSWRHDFGDAVEQLQRAPLRRAQAQAADDGVDVTIH